MKKTLLFIATLLLFATTALAIPPFPPGGTGTPGTALGDLGSTGYPYCNYAAGVCTWTIGTGGATTFNALGSGTNTTSTLTCGTGCTINTSGNGTITVTPITKTAAYTAVAGQRILADTYTTGAFTITLPSSPSVGDTVEIIDSYPYFATNNLTIGRNSQPIAGVAANLVVNVNNSWIKLTYINATYGWYPAGLSTGIQGLQWAYGELR